MNSVQLTGNLCKDIKLEYTKSNKAYLENTIAVPRERKNEDGIRESDFINFVAFENKAEYLGKFAKKGDKIEIEGKIRKDTWQDKDGNYKEKTQIVVDKTQILTSRIKQEKPF